MWKRVAAPREKRKNEAHDAAVESYLAHLEEVTNDATKGRGLQPARLTAVLLGRGLPFGERYHF
jgi:hypothetical protein